MKLVSKKERSRIEAARRNENLMNPIVYKCDDCKWVGTDTYIAVIMDAAERVSVGEIMAAGECPECGSLVSADDRDVPSYTLEDCISLAKKRGILK